MSIESGLNERLDSDRKTEVKQLFQDLIPVSYTHLTLPTKA